MVQAVNLLDSQLIKCANFLFSMAYYWELDNVSDIIRSLDSKVVSSGIAGSSSGCLIMKDYNGVLPLWLLLLP